jgi:hypothetical protein
MSRQITVEAILEELKVPELISKGWAQRQWRNIAIRTYSGKTALAMTLASILTRRQEVWDHYGVY